MKRTDYVNVFHGNLETDLPEPQGLAKTWMILKAQTGNTCPGASYPFGKMTCGPYSAGYPTGNANYMINSCGRPRKMREDRVLRGFSHLHHTGTGGVGYYFNYALTAGFTGDLSDAFALTDMEDEAAEPGFYAASYRGIRHKLYGIGVNPRNGEIYVADAVDYAQAGVVRRYSDDGTLIDQFRVGINPNGFAFK